MDENNPASNPEVEAALAGIKELEKEIALADYELLKEQTKYFQKLYAKRDEIVSKIPNFWLQVFEFFFDSSFENANIEDFEVLSKLTSFKVIRDINEPKEVEYIFTFAPNAYLADDSLTLTKKFSNIQSPDPDATVTSTKVPINWKPGKDLTEPVKGVPPSFFRWFAFEGNGNAKNEFPDSDDLAIELADEIYPHAHKIVQECSEEDSDAIDEDEDLDSDEEDDSDDDDDDEEEEPARKRHKSH